LFITLRKRSYLGVRGDSSAVFFSSFYPSTACRSGNNIVKVAVTPKTTKCRLSHRTLQAATAKYRRGGPPPVIARHSSSRERRGVHRHYTRRGRDVPRFALVVSSAPFFVTFAIGPSRARVLFRAVEVNVPGRCSGNILQSDTLRGVTSVLTMIGSIISTTPGLSRCNFCLSCFWILTGS